MPFSKNAVKTKEENLKGLVSRRYTRNADGAKLDPYGDVLWERRSAVISGADGEVVFRQDNVEVPNFWSQAATNVVASKYFRGKAGSEEREISARQLVDRVANTIRQWGLSDGYFDSEEDADAFRDELKYILIHQIASFNSPVYFNVGIDPKPQCSACFILKVEDNMDSILNWYRNEGMIFKGGSGSGVNLSALRSCREKLSSGGTASGPLSFMKAADASAGVIKSGGKTRRAAKMVVLNADHPDIEDFIRCKVEEEKKAWALIEAGYDPALDGEAYSSVAFQNENHSVRVSDDFMRAAEEDGKWVTRLITTGEVAGEYNARDLLWRIAEAAHACGDPGLQFDSTINLWHTCPNSGRINASNPCSEYMHLDNSACNLASINLLKFLRDPGGFDVSEYLHVVDVMITAQEIIVGRSSYPTEEIERNAHAFRELGLGYANLGALLMALGMPYDSDAGRAYAAALAAAMTGEAYLQSARLAERMGPFAGYRINREAMLSVIERHRKHAAALEMPTDMLKLKEASAGELVAAARRAWDSAYELGGRCGFRNSQATVIAPTGTISFMMDCDTTGIEPDIALVKYKKLVGGGVLKIVNGAVPLGLRRLGYSQEEIGEIIDYLDEHETIEGAPRLKEEHLAVFDCAFKPKCGLRSIAYAGHVRMMAAVQPFLSGAISKTVNLPSDASPKDVYEAFIMAWKLGLKAIAVYRDGSKGSQPLSTSIKQPSESANPAAERPGQRKRLPDERKAIQHRFEIAGHEGYISVGLYDDGRPGEVFVKMSKEGSTISGLMDSFAIAISYALQYGVPLSFLVNKFSHMRFEPSGFTKNQEIPYAKSIVDYLFRWMASKFLDDRSKREVGVIRPGHVETGSPAEALEISPITDDGKDAGGGRFAFVNQADAPACPDCGLIMVRNGACYKCLNCGSSSGCS